MVWLAGLSDMARLLFPVLKKVAWGRRSAGPLFGVHGLAPATTITPCRGYFVNSRTPPRRGPLACGGCRGRGRDRLTKGVCSSSPLIRQTRTVLLPISLDRQRIRRNMASDGPIDGPD